MLEGLFVCSEAEYTALLSEHVDFGEVLGKHSEIACDLDTENLTVLSHDQEKLGWTTWDNRVTTRRGDEDQ